MSNEPVSSDFVFVLCQAGAEPALKAELAREHPELRFAYSRPGFVTFKRLKKGGGLDPDFELRSVFARGYGLFLEKIGQKNAPSSLEERAQGVLSAIKSVEGLSRLHLVERDQFPPGQEPPGFIPGTWVEAAWTQLQPFLEKHAPALSVNVPSNSGDLVLDLIIVEPEEWWIGFHRQGKGKSPYPGGRPAIELPEEAPSRAYLKLEEALLWSGLPLIKGDTAVEVGSAPGGASYALLRRGVQVTGIDPGKMSPLVLEDPNYCHISKPVFYVKRQELPAKVDWLLCDMNVDPKVAITSVDRVMRELGDSLLGVLLTVKLNSWKMAADIPGMLEYLRKSGLSRVRARQLANNRQEFFVYGLTRKGLRRLAG